MRIKARDPITGRVIASGDPRVSDCAEYRVWINMKSRCLNPRTPGFHNYGGRGITVCEEWMHSFDKFLADMGKRPGPGYSIDRCDVSGNYQPDNCRWATRKEQMRNVRFNRYVTVDGRTTTLAEAVEARGLVYSTVLHRLLRGDSDQEAFR